MKKNRVCLYYIYQSYFIAKTMIFAINLNRSCFSGEPSLPIQDHLQNRKEILWIQIELSREDYFSLEEKSIRLLGVLIAWYGEKINMIPP